ncbi:hypothetical protein LCGC14_2866780 [marine sediment metagenome]|uniref:Uncharacterized protein n=1 Tax=marine sediment metagenome TaxID=412755 RepID=A0A0F9ACA4_9ZZZZ
MKEKDTIRCEGQTKIGAFQMGGYAGWRQCENDAVIILKVRQDKGKITDQPSCDVCWKRAKKYTNVEIVENVEVL